jgi:hypothetical protein
VTKHNEAISPPTRPFNQSTLPDNIEAAIRGYGQRITDSAWPSVRDEAASIARRAQPLSPGDARRVMGLIWQVTQHARRNNRWVTPSQALTVRNVETYLLTVDTAHARSTYRSALHRILATVHDLPAPKRRPNISARRQRPLTAVESRWLGRLTSGRESLADIMHDGLTPIVLETVGRHVHRGDIASHQEALRG